MKGSATIIGNITGYAAATGILNGKAAVVDNVRGSAVTSGPVKGYADRTRDTGLFHWLQVSPAEPQQLVWLNPQYGIDYHIETSTNLKWAIN